MKEAEAMVRLADAMDKLGMMLERFTDPVVWQKVLSDAVRQIPALGQSLTVSPVVPVTQLPPLFQLEGVSISLSAEGREKLVNQVYEAVKPQLVEFTTFVKQSLMDMPSHRLKRIADKVAAGEKPELQRREGCVFIKAGDEESYLNL